MLKLNFSKKTAKFLHKIPQKHGQQIALKIQSLQENPYPQDAKRLKGVLGNYTRVDSGEYRIIFELINDTIYLVLIGKRNDDEVYRKLRNIH